MICPIALLSRCFSFFTSHLFNLALWQFRLREVHLTSLSLMAGNTDLGVLYGRFIREAKYICEQENQISELKAA